MSAEWKYDEKNGKFVNAHPSRITIAFIVSGIILGMLLGPFSPGLGWLCVTAGVVIGIIKRLNNR